MSALEVAQKQPSKVNTDQIIMTAAVYMYKKSPSIPDIGIAVGVAVLASLATLLLGFILGKMVHRCRHGSPLQQSESVTSSENQTGFEIHESDIPIEDVPIREAYEIVSLSNYSESSSSDYSSDS